MQYTTVLPRKDHFRQQHEKGSSAVTSQWFAHVLCMSETRTPLPGTTHLLHVSWCSATSYGIKSRLMFQGLAAAKIRRCKTHKCSCIKASRNKCHRLGCSLVHKCRGLAHSNTPSKWRFLFKLTAHSLMIFRVPRTHHNIRQTMTTRCSWIKTFCSNQFKNSPVSAKINFCINL